MGLTQLELYSEQKLRDSQLRTRRHYFTISILPVWDSLFVRIV